MSDDLAGGALAAAVGVHLAGWPRSRIRIEDLERLLIAERPELAGSAERGTRLARLCDELVAGGVAQPGRRRVARLGVVVPALFTLATRTGADADRRPEAAVVTTWPWVSELAFLAALRRQLSPAVLGRLQQLNGWLAANPDAEPAPERERSLEVFGDDKALAELTRSVLSGRVPAGLRAYPVPPPMLVEPTGSGRPAVIVVENHTTFHSLLRVGSELAAGGAGPGSAAGAGSGSAAGAGPQVPGFVAYGVGNQAPSLVASLSRFAPGELFYFGDLDHNGLAIAAGAARAAAEAGLPPLRPHLGLYSLLLTTGRPQQRPPGARAGWPEEGLAWCGPELARRVREVLGSDCWLAQEWVGVHVLRRHRWW